MVWNIFFFHISEVDVTMHNTCHTRGPSMAPSATPATQKHTSRHNREHASYPRKRVRVTSEGHFRVTTEGTHGLPVLDHTTPQTNEGVEAPGDIWRQLVSRSLPNMTVPFGEDSCSTQLKMLGVSENGLPPKWQCLWGN